MEDSLALEHAIYALTSKIMSGKGFDQNYPYRKDMIEHCYHEVIKVMTKATLSVDSIYPYSIRIISNSINNFQRRHYVNGSKITISSLDFLCADEEGNALNGYNIIPNIRNHEADILTYDLIQKIRIEYNNPRAFNWLILEAFFGYSTTEISQLYHISPSYICREKKKFCQKIINSHGEELRDCLAKLQKDIEH